MAFKCTLLQFVEGSHLLIKIVIGIDDNYIILTIDSKNVNLKTGIMGEIYNDKYSMTQPVLFKKIGEQYVCGSIHINAQDFPKIEETILRATDAMNKYCEFSIIAEREGDIIILSILHYITPSISHIIYVFTASNVYDFFKYGVPLVNIGATFKIQILKYEPEIYYLIEKNDQVYGYPGNHPFVEELVDRLRSVAYHVVDM